MIRSILTKQDYKAKPSFSTTGTVSYGTPPATDLQGWWNSENAYTDSGNTTPCVSDGDLVYSLKDLSGGTRHLIQSTIGNRPFFRNVGTPVIPRISFTGVVNGTTLSTSVVGLTLPATIYLLMQPLGVPNCCLLGLGTGYELSSNGGSSVSNPMMSLFQSSPVFFPSEVSDHVDMWQIQIDAAGKLTGVTGDTTTSQTTGTTAYTTFILGGNILNDAANNTPLSFYEGLVYNAAHVAGSGDGLLVRQYLNSKYGLGYTL